MKIIVCWKLAFLLFICAKVSFVYGQDAKPIKIGIIGAEEGEYSFFEKRILDGILYAIEEKNSAKISIGSSSMPIMHVEKDNSSNNTVEIVQDFIKEEFHLIIGPNRSSQAKLILEAEPLNIVVLSAYATATSLTDAELIKASDIRKTNSQWFFRATSTDKARAEDLAKWMNVEHPLKNNEGIVLIFDTVDEYGKGLEKDMDNWFKSKDRRVIPIGYETENDHVKNTADIIQKLEKRGQIEAIAVLGFSSHGSEIIRDIKNSKLKNVKIYCIEPTLDLAKGIFVGKEFNGVRVVANQFLDSGDSDAQNFEKDYKIYYERKNNGQRIDYVSNTVAFGYDAALLALEALKKSVSDSSKRPWRELNIHEQRERIRENLEKVSALDRVMSLSTFDEYHNIRVKTQRYYMKDNRFFLYSGNQKSIDQWFVNLLIAIIGGLIGGVTKIGVDLIQSSQVKENLKDILSKPITLMLSIIAGFLAYIMWDIKFVQQIYPHFVSELSVNNALQAFFIGFLAGFTLTIFSFLYEKGSTKTTDLQAVK
jgi:ABC-type branched-subunit amino acid transport system substrate-binding protein